MCMSVIATYDMCNLLSTSLLDTEKTQRREPLTVPKPLWLVAGQADPVCHIIGVLLAKNCIYLARHMKTANLRWKWAIKKVIGLNRAKENIIYAWRRCVILVPVGVCLSKEMYGY